MNLKYLLSGIFVGSIVVANVTAAKVASIGGMVVPAGFIAIAIAFLASDLLSELYGPRAAHDTVNAAIGALVVGWALIYAAIWLPAAPFYTQQSAYAGILGSSNTIVLAGICTMLVSQHLDVRVFHEIRQRVSWRFARNVGSTATSQFVDTALFVTLAFGVFPTFLGGMTMGANALWALIVGQYVVKVGVAVLDTPVFYAVTELARR